MLPDNFGQTTGAGVLVGRRWKRLQLEGLNYLRKQPDEKLPSLRQAPGVLLFE